MRIYKLAYHSITDFLGAVWSLLPFICVNNECWCEYPHCHTELRGRQTSCRKNYETQGIVVKLMFGISLLKWEIFCLHYISLLNKYLITIFSPYYICIISANISDIGIFLLCNINIDISPKNLISVRP